MLIKYHQKVQVAEIFMVSYLFFVFCFFLFFPSIQLQSARELQRERVKDNSKYIPNT